MSARAAVAALALLAGLALLPAAQASEQPREAPAELRTGQETAFGGIEMEPYVPMAQGAADVPVEAHIVLRDLDALDRADTLLLALNLHAHEADLTVDGVVAGDGAVLPPLRMETGENGLQQQVFVDAGEVARHAADGAVALTFRGHAAPHHRGQVHVGALVVAYSADWVQVRSSDGPAQLYAYSLVQSTVGGGGLMPFHGEGNSLLVLPIVALSTLVLVAGGVAVQSLRNDPDATPLPSPVPLPQPMPTAARPAPPSATPAPPTAARTVILGRTEIELADLPVFGSPVKGPPSLPPAPVQAQPTPPASPAQPAPASPVQVFGSGESPPLRKRIVTPAGVVQGPLLPPHWGRPQPSSIPATETAAAKPPAPTPAAAPPTAAKSESAPAPAASSKSPAPSAAPPTPAPSAPKEPPKPAPKRTAARPAPKREAKPALTAVRRPKPPAKRPTRPSAATSKAAKAKRQARRETASPAPSASAAAKAQPSR